MGPKCDLSSAFSKLQTNDEEKWSLITAVTVDKGTKFSQQYCLQCSCTTSTTLTYKHNHNYNSYFWTYQLLISMFIVQLSNVLYVSSDFVVSGDVRGNMWFVQLTGDFSWSSRKPVRAERLLTKWLVYIFILYHLTKNTAFAWMRKQYR